MKDPRFLLVNPVIHDFAAYDFWAKPLGLLVLAKELKKLGAEVNYIDCADPLSKWLDQDRKQKRKPFGHGRFARQAIEKPSVLPDIGRKFCRYGLSPDEFVNALQNTPKPDAILVTSMMTYWYAGVFETIEICKKHYPDVPVILGGVYATLCEDHAKNSLADCIASGNLETSLEKMGKFLSWPIEKIEEEPLPDYSLIKGSDSAALLTSRGCPNRCLYCGVHALFPGFYTHPVSDIIDSVSYIAKNLGIVDVALYDDAFLSNTKRAMEILDGISNLPEKIRLHAASGMACRGLTPEIANALFRAGAKTIRLGLETADKEKQKQLGAKVFSHEFESAVENLLNAGFDKQNIGVYVLVGLPEQEYNEVEESVKLVRKHGLKPHLAEFSPIPHSPMFDEAKKHSKFDLDEPLFHNPTLLPTANAEIDRQAIIKLRHLQH